MKDYKIPTTTLAKILDKRTNRLVIQAQIHAFKDTIRFCEDTIKHLEKYLCEMYSMPLGRFPEEYDDLYKDGEDVPREKE
jgi:hypothetical protein